MIDFLVKDGGKCKHALGDVMGKGEVEIGSVLEILKYDAGMSSVLSCNPGKPCNQETNTPCNKHACAWNAALIYPWSIELNIPQINDAKEILKYLANNKDNFIDNPVSKGVKP